MTEGPLEGLEGGGPGGNGGGRGGFVRLHSGPGSGWRRPAGRLCLAHVCAHILHWCPLWDSRRTKTLKWNLDKVAKRLVEDGGEWRRAAHLVIFNSPLKMDEIMVVSVTNGLSSFKNVRGGKKTPTFSR